MARENSNEGRNAGPGGPGGAAGGKGGRGGGGRQVYSGPIGPMPKTGDPMGPAGQHFNEKGIGFGGFLDGIFGYENVGQRVRARQNVVSRGNAPVAIVPSYPWASNGYLAASMLSAPMSPPGAMAAVPGIMAAIANNRPYESLTQKIAREVFGATRGPRGPDVGVGHDRAGAGQALAPWMPKTATPATQPITMPTQQPSQSLTPPVTSKAPWMMAQRPLRGPSNYNINLPVW